MSEDKLNVSVITFSGEIAPFAKAFVAAQKATEAVKKAASNHHFKSKYADLAEVVEAVVPALNANGIGVIQSPSFDGDLVGVTTVLIHESGAMAQSTLHLRPMKGDAQQCGSAITYARRYALLAMTGAAPEDDDANAASAPRQQQRREEVKVKEPTLAERLDNAITHISRATTKEAVDKLYTQTTELRADLARADKAGLERLEDALTGRVAELENTPFDNKG